jgi:hypothetical protein
MNVVRADHMGWHRDHPTGEIEFKYLLTGDPLAPDNFMLILGRQIADFSMPRHRHNFEQIRLPLRGDMNIGDGMVLRQGQIGYFPEGLPYGPQQDPLGTAPPGERVQLVLQFGGASGYGFMSMDQRKQAWAELSKTGKFVGPHYHHADGRVEWGLNVVWEHVFHTKLKYPKPRYENVVIVEPNRFHWLPLAGNPGVRHRFMGSFSERAVRMEMIQFDGGAMWSSADRDARRLLYVLRGSGQLDRRDIAADTAIQIEPGEVAMMMAAEPLELLSIALPPIELPVEPSAAYEIEELER